MRTRLVLLSALSTVLVAATASRDVVAAAGPPSGRLVLTSFVQRGRTDIRRNEVLEFRFSRMVSPKSVDLRTLQVVELIPEGRRPVVGARIVQGNVVRLDPRRSQRNYDASIEPNSAVFERDHDVGFSASADFEVLIPAGDGKRVLRAKGGGRIARRYLGTFRTNTLYDDPYPGQPETATYPLSFSPAPATPFGLIDPDATLLIQFSEPILPESMRLGETVIVRRASDDAIVDGTLTPSSFALHEYSFTPTGGWGSDVTVWVELTTGITDLAGNALRRPMTKAGFVTKTAE